MSILDTYGDDVMAAASRYIAPPKVEPEKKFSAWRALSAVPRGAAEAGMQVLASGTELATAGAYMRDTPTKDMPSGVPVDAMQSDLADALRDRGREFRPDPQTSHVAEEVIYGFARGATKIVAGALAAGPVGVLAAGVEEGMTQADELKRQGVTDMETRAKAGAVQGAGLALAVLPVLGTSLKATAGLYLAGGPGGFMAQQALTREILRGSSPDGVAAQFDPFDPVGLAVASLIPAGFAAWGIRGQRVAAAAKAAEDFRTGPVPSEAAPVASAVRAAYSPEVVDAARVAYAGEARAASQINGDSMPASAAHEAALARAEEQMARGEPVQVADALPEVAAARTAIAAEVQDQLIKAGQDAPTAAANAELIAARYVTRAERRGLGEDPLQLYRAEGVKFASADTISGGRTLGQNDTSVLNQSAVQSLTSAAERGERITGTRASFAPEEKAAVDASAEKIGVSKKEITDTVRGHKLAHPTAQGWAPLTFVRSEVDKGKVVYVYKPVPYSFSSDVDGGQLKAGTAAYQKRVRAVAKAMTDEVRRVFQRAADGDKNAANILAQAGWYKAMRSRLRQEFGGLGDLFADLLGATSPNTPVRDNWSNAVDVLRRASRGDFDALMPKWVEWADTVDALEADFRGWFNERLAEGLSKKDVKALPAYEEKRAALAEARKLDDALLPTKETGKKYGFNGRNSVRALVDLWRVVRNADADIARGDTAPKALNFSGNLIGFRTRATIDVWAARMLQRLAGGLRIPSMAETGVSGAMREDGSTTLQFGFGQDVFTEAVKRIRADGDLKTDKVLAVINDDDLQAVVWFVEKELWTVNNWTSVAGEGGSFELEANLSGSADQARIKELRRVADSSKSTPKQKADAKTELQKLERTVDRFVGGLSIQTSLDTQGVDYVPTNADMARMGNAVRLAAYETDNGSTVLASKALATEGRYGGVERSLDIEVVAREGYDAGALWERMLREAQASKQDSTFLSRVLRDDEEPDLTRHRPGVEIYFREAASREKLEAALADLAKEGVEFLTVIVDGRRSPAAIAGEMPPAVGVRLQYVPEFEQRYGMDSLNGLDDVALAAKMKGKADELAALAERVTASVDGVSFAGRFWYETQVAFSAQYQEKINAFTTRAAEGTTGPVGSPKWAGESVRAGVEGADRQAREAAGGKPDGVGAAADDPVGRDAQPGLTLYQGGDTPRGQINFNDGRAVVSLFEKADQSTVIHESSHAWLEELVVDAGLKGAPRQLVDDLAAVRAFLGNDGGPLTVQQHELFARAGETYLMEGKAPSAALARVFDQFKQWLTQIYRTVLGLDANLTPEVRAVFDRLLATDAELAVRTDPLPAFSNAIDQLRTARDELAGRVPADEILNTPREQPPPVAPTGKPRDLQAEVIALRKQEIVLNKLLECLNG